MADAFNASIINSLQHTIRQLYLRRMRVGKLSLTSEEYIHTFVPSPAREIFRDIAPWEINARRSSAWNLPLAEGRINATLQINQGKHALPLPLYPDIQADAPNEVVQRIMDWAMKGGDASREFGRVNAVLEKLNTSYSRVTMRYYWPTILALLSESNSTKQLVPELQDLRAPANPKPLPHGLLQACRQTAETISSVRLLPPDTSEEDPGEVSINIMTGQEYKEPFGRFFGLS